MIPTVQRTALEYIADKRSCAPVGEADACIYARSGSCDASVASRFAINDVIA